MTPQPEPAFDDLAARLRAARPVAPEPLRARVLELATATAPAPTRRVRRVRRPLALVLVPALLVALVAGGALLGRNGTQAHEESAGTGGGATGAHPEPASPVPARARPAGSAADAERSAEAAATAPAPGAAFESSPFAPPSTRRLQEYRADLRVHVASLDDLSLATTKAMAITRSLRGYVVRAAYGAPGDGDGDSTLVVRVPVGNVAQAVLRFAGLGTVIGQQVSIEDLQLGLNRQNDRIRALRGTIATLERELRRDDLTDDARARLRARLQNARETLAARLNAREATERRGRLALVALTLTTREGAEVAPPAPPGRFEQTLRDALDVLATLTVWLLAALIVAGPFLLLAAIGVLLEQRRRRRGDERLLERA